MAKSTTPAKSANLALRLPPVIKSALAKAAAADRRSVSGYVEKVLADHLVAEGFLFEGGSKPK
ncbi:MULTISPECIES: hypothetical protein [unclassified Mesorhizobium]|uniref:hypothetical protein n=1 Tax=unclassified Mesorhizobium TaxID=325217 RepID=UPI001CC995EB|nr:MULTISPECIES: hypothetical protein [unclassified Mesorhizobium]MBZ9741029.1 hypothetical protein [Mesorhizobium sp. CO1-1-4]MBZ9804362.1 hypothetical protein [Mesorhizobium sp. ES1-6]